MSNEESPLDPDNLPTEQTPEPVRLRIPRRMFFFYHQFTMPFMRWLSLYSFRKLNPDWEIVLMGCRDASLAHQHAGGGKIDTSGEFSPPAGVERASYDQLRVALWGVDLPAGKSIPQAADFFKWQALERYGGWFADTDILWIDSMERVAKECERSDVAIGLGRGGEGGLELVGSVRGSALCREMMLGANTTRDERFQGAGEYLLRKVIGLDSPDPRPAVNIAAIRGKFPTNSFTFLPPQTVLPWDLSDISQIFDHDSAVPEIVGKSSPIIGIHWYGSSGRGNHWLRKLTAENYGQPENLNTFTHYARNLLLDTGD